VSDLTVDNIHIVDCFAWHDAIAVCRGNFDMDRNFRFRMLRACVACRRKSNQSGCRPRNQAILEIQPVAWLPQDNFKQYEFSYLDWW
jgi:hypothetical protein